MTDDQILEGDPVQTAMVEGSTDEPVQENIDSTPAEPLYKGMTGHIESVDDLKTYTQNLEQMVIQQRAQSQNQPSPIASTLQQPFTAPKSSNEPQFEELLFSNPQAAKELLKKEIRAERDNERAAENQKKKFWEDFYAKNDDLRKETRLVDFYVKANWDSLKDAPMEQAAQIIAKGTREVIGDVRKRYGVTERELPSGGAATFGASGEPAPRIVGKAPAPKSLTDQIKEMRSARRRN